MAIRVGRVPYLHAEPFYMDMERRGITLYELVPSAVTAAAVHGEIDAGPLPLVDCFRLADDWQPVGGFCVATVQRTNCVFLHSTRPIDALDGAHISVTDEASTAPRLLDILLRLKYQVRPAAYVPMQAPHDAFLLIGNQGLLQQMGMPGFPYIYDLGTEWRAWTGLPFVFSRWMARQDIDPSALALLKDTLYVGLEEGVNALYALQGPREDLLLLPRDVVRYIQGYRYYIGHAEQQAIDLFWRYLQQLEP